MMTDWRMAQLMRLATAVVLALLLLPALPADGGNGNGKGGGNTGDGGGDSGGGGDTQFVPAIVYVGPEAHDLLVMNSEGTASKVLLTGSDTMRHRSPSFSPDGSLVAFVSELEGPGIYVMPADGSSPPRKLVSLEYWHPMQGPDWSPDGRFLIYGAFVLRETDPPLVEGCEPCGKDMDLFLLELTPDAQVLGEPTRLTNTPDLQEYRPQWSHDGTRLSARVWVTGNEEQIFLFNFDELSRLLSTRYSLTAQIGTMDFMSGSPQWTKSETLPDIITFSGRLSAVPGPYSLWYVIADNPFEFGQLLENEIHEWSPSWSPDDQRLVFSRSGMKSSRAGLFILNNARDIILGASTSPDVQETAAKAGGKVQGEFLEPDWNPAP